MDGILGRKVGMTQIFVEDGTAIPVLKGSHWPASDPVVKRRPALFTSDARFGLLYTVAPPGFDMELNEVEEATANPGERRSVRRS